MSEDEIIATEEKHEKIAAEIREFEALSGTEFVKAQESEISSPEFQISTENHNVNVVMLRRVYNDEVTPLITVYRNNGRDNAVEKARSRKAELETMIVLLRAKIGGINDFLNDIRKEMTLEEKDRQRKEDASYKPLPKIVDTVVHDKLTTEAKLVKILLLEGFSGEEAKNVIALIPLFGLEKSKTVILDARKKSE